MIWEPAHDILLSGESRLHNSRYSTTLCICGETSGLYVSWIVSLLLKRDKFEHVFSCFSIGWGFLQSRFTWYSSFWFTTQLLIQSLLSFASTEALEVDPGNLEGGLAKVLGIKYECLCMTNYYWCLSMGEETDGSFIFLIYLYCLNFQK